MPLGDVLDQRRFVPLVVALSAVMLLGAALAPTFPVLLAVLGGVGLTAVGAQLLAPLAGELAEPERRGRIVGPVASGVQLSDDLLAAVDQALGDAPITKPTLAPAAQTGVKYR